MRSSEWFWMFFVFVHLNCIYICIVIITAPKYDLNNQGAQFVFTCSWITRCFFLGFLFSVSKALTSQGSLEKIDPTLPCLRFSISCRHSELDSWIGNPIVPTIWLVFHGKLAGEYTSFRIYVWYIYLLIYHKNQPNAGKCTSPMDPIRMAIATPKICLYFFLLPKKPHDSHYTPMGPSFHVESPSV